MKCKNCSHFLVCDSVLKNNKQGWHKKIEDVCKFFDDENGPPKRTGILDRNGREMRLGDKVRPLFFDSHGQLAVVVWNKACAKFQVMFTEDALLDFGYLRGEDLEVFEIE